MKSHHALSALWVLCMAACAPVGPNYRLPAGAAVNTPDAQASLSRAHGGEISDAPVPAAWWHLYDDPVMNDLIAAALRSNTDLRVAAANLARSRAQVSEAEAAIGFGGSASASVQRAQESAQAFLLTEKVPVTNIGDFGISVSYQFDLFGTLRRGIEAARAEDESVEAAADVARITIVADVARAYIESCSAADDANIARHSLALQQQSAQLTERLRLAGRGNQPDVTRSLTQVQTVSAEIPRFEARQQAAQYRLAMLLAIAPEALPAAVRVCGRTPRIRQSLPVGDGAALLKRRPDIREAERRLAAATARIGVATGELYPSVSFGASAGLTGAIADIGAPSAQRWGFGPLISWNFPAHGARQRVQEAQAGAQAELARFDGVVLNALRETRTTLSTYAADLRRLQALEGARTSAARSAAETHRLYIAGRDSFLSDLDASRTLTSVEAQVAEAEDVVAQDQVNLFLALGGGWNTDTQAPAVKNAVPR
ncbi:efflux transporter, outer membrane factor (OMF) lipoprotein, NodT family [Burkholderia sp. WP9]|uniref:efflux transporter outer membrane subunit n=1 Tax=Burkholderia sp. WP9 TaxID=1500263 RepID=UPI00089AE826|nr:efflux transporter outer membrane subunit [Burkholderia sp. WP9]SEF12609.1 efflux transporter, outer membrane factor (OMF) lipoprotein, NodT family [Burkholderia sp. WP9]